MKLFRQLSPVPVWIHLHRKPWNTWRMWPLITIIWQWSLVSMVPPNSSQTLGFNYWPAARSHCMLLHLGGGQVKDCLLKSNQTLQITGGVIWHANSPLCPNCIWTRSMKSSYSMVWTIQGVFIEAEDVMNHHIKPEFHRCCPLWPALLR